MRIWCNSNGKIATQTKPRPKTHLAAQTRRAVCFTMFSLSSKIMPTTKNRRLHHRRRWRQNVGSSESDSPPAEPCAVVVTIITVGARLWLWFGDRRLLLRRRHRLARRGKVLERHERHERHGRLRLRVDERLDRRHLWLVVAVRQRQHVVFARQTRTCRCRGET
jgi:hypothetical protein